jgi:hypothetical protein
MATPPAAPPPIPLAGLTTPPPAPSVPPDGNPDGPITIPSDTLSKIGADNLPPGSVGLATIRVKIAGTPDAPEAQITAVGEMRPDDPSIDLTNLSNDSTQAPGDLSATIGGPGDDQESTAEPDDDKPDLVPPGGKTVPQGDPYASIGFKPKSPKKKTVSAKDVFGE